MMQAFYYTHHIPAAELAVDVAEASPFRLSLDFDVEKDILVSMQDEVLPIKVLIDRDKGFNEPVELAMSYRSKLFSLEPTSILPEENEKTIYIKLDKTLLGQFKKRKSLPLWQMNIVGTVKGEVERQGKRTFQNAKYREITPYFQVRLTK